MTVIGADDDDNGDVVGRNDGSDVSWNGCPDGLELKRRAVGA